MLKSLLSKVKSEKSQSQSSKISLNSNFQPQSQTLKLEQPFNYIPLKEHTIVPSNIKTIRYSVLQNSLDIYKRVVACPISVFNKLVYAKRLVKEIDLKKNAFPTYLMHLKSLLSDQLPTYNHLLINVYPPGIGIMPHFDGPLYRSKVVVLSLGGPAIISFSQNYANTKKISRLLLQDQSIHIFEGEAYEKVLHGIEDFAVDCIFILVKDQQNIGFIIEKSTVANYVQTNLHKIVLQKLRKAKQGNSLSEEQDLTSEMGSGCCLIPVIQNEAISKRKNLYYHQIKTGLNAVIGMIAQDNLFYLISYIFKVIQQFLCKRIQRFPPIPCRISHVQH